MAGNITNLIRRDFYALWTEKGTGSAVFIPLIIVSPVAPAWKFFTLFFLPFILQLYSNNSFILEEKYGTAGYFASLPVRRKDIVLSRYFGVAVLTASHLALAYSGNLAFRFSGMLKFQLQPGYFALSLFIVSLLTSISLPFYFKFGATKVMNGVTIAFAIAFYAAIFVIATKPELAEKVRSLSFTDTFTASLLLTGAAILIFVVSIKISTEIYSKRDI